MVKQKQKLLTSAIFVDVSIFRENLVFIAIFEVTRFAQHAFLN